MKLDLNLLRSLSPDHFKVLATVERAMKKDGMKKKKLDLVPSHLICRIAALKGTEKALKYLACHDLLHHDSSKYDGYRLTSLGYDYLAIKNLVDRGVFVEFGLQIGEGKESEIHEVRTKDGTLLALKVHRLGKTSFRAVKLKRDYSKHRNSSCDWFFLSSSAARYEFAFMKALKQHDFPVPSAVAFNRHCVVMSLVEGYPLVQVKQLQNPEAAFDTIIGLIVRLAEHGLIHCDFNEYNLMIDDDEKITMIDFPQMVSVSHPNAQMYFDRDVECVFKFFKKRFDLSFEDHNTDESRICLSSIAKDADCLDKELAASGFTKKDLEDNQQFIGEGIEQNSSDRDGGTEDDECVSGTNEENIKSFDALHLQDQVEMFILSQETS
ncbi:hypothetical protein TIFTF001_006061 [Ficus carica]|uniref:non-specific serine/threonine protein kinase n=1 Tax=Ficus carica TaxID=3494 RepID=A0AA87ZGK8_FICCA|nr:hypothetical protein TIFTF001_006061 [Ficus carica]